MSDHSPNPKELFNKIIQIGVIVRNLEDALDKYSLYLGMESFRISNYPPDEEPDCQRSYMGRKGEFTAKLCFFNYGNIEFELIQPLSGENIWDDFLKLRGDNAIHHLKYLVNDHQQVEDHFKSLGISSIQSGASVGINKGRTWVYYDTLDALGFYVEVMNELPCKS